MPRARKSRPAIAVVSIDIPVIPGTRADRPGRTQSIQGRGSGRSKCRRREDRRKACRSRQQFPRKSPAGRRHWSYTGYRRCTRCHWAVVCHGTSRCSDKSRQWSQSMKSSQSTACPTHKMSPAGAEWWPDHRQGPSWLPPPLQPRAATESSKSATRGHMHPLIARFTAPMISSIVTASSPFVSAAEQFPTHILPSAMFTALTISLTVTW